MRGGGWGRVLFALGLIALGTLNWVFGDFALQWQPVPPWVPERALFAYACGALQVSLGIGVLARPTVAVLRRTLLVYLVLWWLLLKLPRVVMAPLVEVNWLGLGEIAVLVAAGWIIAGSVGPARILLGLALLPIGLSHFIYEPQTAALVPAWLPARSAWVIVTGAAHLAAGIGILLGVWPRLAATLEAWMISAFTLLVWLPRVVAAPTTRLEWTAFFASWVIGAGVWVVADSLPDLRWPSRK